MKLKKIEWCKNWCEQSNQCFGFIHTTSQGDNGRCYFKNNPADYGLESLPLDSDAQFTAFIKASDCPPPTTTTRTTTTTTTTTTTPLPSNAGKLIFLQIILFLNKYLSASEKNIKMEYGFDHTTC